MHQSFKVDASAGNCGEIRVQSIPFLHLNDL